MLATLRQHMGDARLITDREHVQINPEFPLWVDLHDLLAVERTADELDLTHPARLCSRLALWQGGLLIDFYHGFYDDFYDDWITAECELLSIHESNCATFKGFIDKKEIFDMQQLTTQWLAQPSQQHNNEVTIRSIQPSDVGLIYDMHQRLSPDSLYYRYLQVRKPTLDEVAAICYLDPAKGAGFVATTQRNAEIVVGIAYYVREVHTQQPTAEPGILVEDGFQGQGIGRALWQRMQQHAIDNKIQRLRVLFHRTNQRLARLVQSGGLPYQAQASDGLSEYLVALGGLPLSLVPRSSLDRGAMGEGSRYYN